MSEEAAFLEALKANPADDTARLVYADWLDEHGEPAKAEYLRLVAMLARAEQDYAREQLDVARTLALAEQLHPDWRAEAGNLFYVVLYGRPEYATEISIIIAVAEVTGLGLLQTQATVQRPHSVLITCVPFELAMIARDRIREAGGVVHLHPCGKPPDKLPDKLPDKPVARQRIFERGEGDFRRQFFGVPCPKKPRFSKR